MRILIGSLLILLIGGILAAAYTLRPATLSTVELSQINSTCAECHGVPVIRSAASIHASHRNVQCITCHAGGTTARVDFNSCIPCHSVPAYTSSLAVHNAHATTNCIVCHSDAPGLVKANDANDVLKSVGFGLSGFGLVGIVLNFAVIKIRLRKKEDKSR
jgi:hypothetical protein